MSAMLSNGFVGRLDPDELGRPRAHGGSDGVGVGEVDRVELQPPALQHLGEEPVRPAVRVVGDDHVVAGSADRTQQRVLCGEAAGEGHPRRPSSRAARHSSSAVRVGLALREYS
jgi:hypothetical protein